MIENPLLQQALTPGMQKPPQQTGGADTEYLKKLEKFQQLALSEGYDPDEVNQMITQKRAQFLGSKGVPINQITTNPILSGVQANQVAESGYQPGGSDDALTNAYLDQFKTGSIRNIANVPAENRGDVVKALSNQGVNINELQRLQEGRAIAGILSQVKDRYETQNLAGGRIGGNLTRVLAALGMNPEATQYLNLREGAVSGLRELTGDKGTLTDVDVQRIQKLLPKLSGTKEESKLAFEDLDALLKAKYGAGLDELSKQNQNPGGQTQLPQGQAGATNDPLGLGF